MLNDKKKIIIDTDCGSDDAVAIAMALNDPAYKIELITTVSGNVDVEQATKNVLTTIEYANSYAPPVYMGSKEMLLRDLSFAYETHGDDGMGDIGLTSKNLTYTEGNGILKILDTLRNHEDKEIDIIALGPLTNIALAIKLDFEIMKKVNRIIIMGTAGLGVGNVTPTAEFNIWQDAESAKIVTESGIEEIIFVGWDACLGDCILSSKEVDKIRNGGKLGKFAIDCNKQLLAINKDRFGEECLDLADPAAVAAALYSECISECEKYYCEVDISCGPSYGSVLVDVGNTLNKEPNVYICSKLHSAKYKEYIYKTLRVK